MALQTQQHTSTLEDELEKDASAPTNASQAPAFPSRSRLLSRLEDDDDDGHTRFRKRISTHE